MLFKYFDIRNKTNRQQSLLRFEDDGVSLDVTVIPGEETVYLRKEHMLTLFETSRQNIECHITNIYESGELAQGATCKEILQVQFEGDRQVSRLYNYYNLDLIISLAAEEILLSKRASSLLFEHVTLKGGFVMFTYAF